MARRPKLYVLRKNYGGFQPERGVNPTSAYGCGGTCGGWFGGGWGRCNKGCKCRGGLCVARNRREEQMQEDMNFAGYYATGMQGNCEDGYIELPNGGCIEEGLYDPARAKKPPFPFRPTTGPFIPNGAKQGACHPDLCGVPPNCVPCDNPGPQYPDPYGARETEPEECVGGCSPGLGVGCLSA